MSHNRPFCVFKHQYPQLHRVDGLLDAISFSLKIRKKIPAAGRESSSTALAFRCRLRHRGRIRTRFSPLGTSRGEGGEEEDTDITYRYRDRYRRETEERQRRDSERDKYCRQVQWRDPGVTRYLMYSLL